MTNLFTPSCSLLTLPVHRVGETLKLATYTSKASGRRWRPSPPSDRAARFLVDRGLQSACARNDMRRPPAPPASPLQEGPASILGEY